MALKLEFISMIVGALAIDCYWTGRRLLLSSSILNFLPDSVAGGITDVAWEEGPERGFSIHDVVEQNVAVQIAGSLRFSIRQYMRDRNSIV